MAGCSVTASQRPERVDRDALIEAMVNADIATRRAAHPRFQRPEWAPYWSQQRSAAADRVAIHLDAVLPLIADTIEAELYEPWRGDATCTGHDRGIRKAARLVRSLGDQQ